MDLQTQQLSPATEQARVVDAQVIEAEISRELGDVLTAVQPLLVIKTDEDRARAVAYGVASKVKVTNLKVMKDKFVKPAYNLYVYYRDLFDAKIKAVEGGMNALRQGISVYDVEKERLARLERERLEAERRRQEEEHKKQLAAWQLEQDHTAAIADDVLRAQAKKEAADKVERDRKIKEEEDGRLSQAQAAKDLGMGDRVEQILEKTTAIAPAAAAPAQLPPPTAAAAPAQLPPPPPPPPPASVPAIVAVRPDPDTLSRDEWKYELDNIVKLAAAVAEGRAPADYLSINRAPVRKDLNRLKDRFACDGIRTWKERNTTFRTAKTDAEVV